jgi:hypothetical protein
MKREELMARAYRRQILIRIGILCAAFIAVVVLIYLHMGNPFDRFDDRRFSVAEWRTADAETRAGMARDIVRNQLVPGSNESRVTNLLGDPEKVISGTDPGGNKLPGIKTFTYYLGCGSGSDFDDAFLYVHFDEAGTVISVEINGY